MPTVCVCVSECDGSCSRKVLNSRLIFMSNQWEHMSLRGHGGESLSLAPEILKLCETCQQSLKLEKSVEVLLMLRGSVFLWLHPPLMGFGHRGTCSSLRHVKDSRWPLHTDNVRWEIHKKKTVTKSHRWNGSLILRSWGKIAWNFRAKKVLFPTQFITCRRSWVPCKSSLLVMDGQSSSSPT